MPFQPRSCSFYARPQLGKCPLLNLLNSSESDSFPCAESGLDLFSADDVGRPTFNGEHIEEAERGR